MDFSNRNLMELFEWNGVVVYLTDTLLATWVVMGILILFAIITRIKLRNFKDVPRGGFQHFIETIIEQIDGLTATMMAPSLQRFSSFFFGIFAFILLSNYIGMIGLRPPTADLSTTLAMALTIFVLVHYIGLRYQPKAYFKAYFQPVFLFFPMNVVGELAKPVSLSFRLFGNILGGLIIMGLVYQLLPVVLTILLPSVLHLYFDVLVGALQAFIFTVLSMTFISQKGSVPD